MNNNDQQRYILVIEDKKGKKTINLEQETYSVGRHRTNSIVINSEEVSRHHATLIRKKSDKNEYSFWIVDGDNKGNVSQNGIFVNGKQCLEQELKHGDKILFGTEATASFHIINSNIENLLKKIEIKKSNILENSQETNTTTKKNQVINKPVSIINKEKILKLASFPESTPYPIIEIDLLKTAITYVNPAANQKFQDLANTKLSHPLIKDVLKNLNVNKQGNLFSREVKIGEKVYEEYIQYLPENKLLRIYVIEITKHKKNEEKLKYQANYDSVTNLPNRIFFKEQLTIALENAKKHNYNMVIMFLSLVTLNETLSHGIKDQLLKSFVQRLTTSLGIKDVVARWEGYEFAVLLPKIIDLEEVRKISQKIIYTIKLPFSIEGQKISLECTIGIAIYPEDGDNGEILLKKADAANCRIKNKAANKYQFYSIKMNDDPANEQLLQSENILHQALEKGEFLLYYQPQMNIKTGHIFGLEALLRWQHSQRGLVYPQKFIPQAQETDLILSLGEWALQTAIAQNQAWQKAGLPQRPVAVNLSEREFYQANLAAKIAQILTKTGLEPKWLELEITEVTLSKNLELALKIMRELQRLGVKLSLDDFGIGSSSLVYLQKFPFHRLKIDQSLVRNLKYNSDDLGIIKAAIALGRAFNMQVMAEGVETEQQLELLRSLECDEIQGYLLSQPLSAEKINTVISEIRRFS